MQLRRTQYRRKGKLYVYAQLVESYRRPDDGMPTHRVVANLGQLNDQAFENLKTALAASREGKQVVQVVGTQVGVHGRNAPGRLLPKPLATLRYLDLAVLLHLFRTLKLDELLAEVLPQHDSEVPAWAVVAALTLQRCVAPRSKLYAQRWFPRTALPELVGISPRMFNNTRLHRVLDELDRATPAVMSRLPKRYQADHGRFSALFVDVTDTWFVGHGPPLAQRAKTKEGLVLRKIGIVLLCDARGYPCRWQVISGKTADANAMTTMVRDIAGIAWAKTAPLVCDRAMGHTAHIGELLRAKLPFVTALVRSEFDAYTAKIPYQRFEQMGRLAQQDKQAIQQVASVANQTQMAAISDDLYVLELGVLTHQQPDQDQEQDTLADPTAGADNAVQEPTRAQRAIQLGRNVRERVATGQAASYPVAANQLGITYGQAKKFVKYALDLAEPIQQALLSGEGRGVSMYQLTQLMRGHPEPQEQLEAFSKLVAQGDQPRRRPSRPTASSPATPQAESDPVRIRCVAYFVPSLFVQKRRTAYARLEQIDAFVTQLNERLQAKRCRMTQRKVVAAIDAQLRKYNLVDAFKVELKEVSTPTGTCVQADVTVDNKQWAKRRRYDGFCVLAAHPEVKQSAADLVKLYRSKDMVEKDFEIIKSLVKLRPVRHRTDTKVRAHVTLCMLALVLQRMLADRLGISAEAAIELLATCTLSALGGATKRSAAYLITAADADQMRLLKRLQLEHLVDDDLVMEQITPRPH